MSVGLSVGLLMLALSGSLDAAEPAADAPAVQQPSSPPILPAQPEPSAPSEDDAPELAPEPAPAPTPAPAPLPPAEEPAKTTPAPVATPDRIRGTPPPIRKASDQIRHYPVEDEEVLGERLTENGEWYVPDAYDKSLRDQTRDAWNGLYRAIEFRTTIHGFFRGGVAGDYGTLLMGKLDLSPTFGINLGTYLPNGVVTGGVSLFGNYRKRVVESQRADVSFGLLTPELDVNVAYIRDPATGVLSAGLHLFGLRVVVADLVQVSLRPGVPTFWLTLPQVGTAASWSTTIDVGLSF